MKNSVLVLLIAVLGFLHPTAASGEIWHGCALLPNGREAWVAAIETVLIAQTTDRGSNWLYHEMLTNHDFFDIFFLDSFNGWTCGTIAEVWHTTDGGNSWAWQGFGTSKFFTRIFFLDTDHGWAAAGSAIMGRWDKEGQTWQQIILPYPEFSPDTTDFYGVSFVDTLNGWICAGRYPTGDTFIGGQGYIGRTRDGGLTWNLLLRDTVYDLFDIRFLDTLCGFVVGGDDRNMSAYIGRTTDGGITWHRASVAAAGMLRALDFSDSRHGWACGKFGTILATSDGGTTWIPQSSGVDTTLFDIDFVDSLSGVACGANVVLFTSDGGTTWQRASPGALAEQPIPASCCNLIDLSVHPSILASRKGFFSISGVVPKSSSVTLEVFRPDGRLVRRLLSNHSAQERFCVRWDGRDEQGTPVVSGVYLLRLSTDQGTVSRRVVYFNERKNV